MRTITLFSKNYKIFFSSVTLEEYGISPMLATTFKAVSKNSSPSNLK
nr:hypothetical protein [Brachyspira hampsonii]